MALSPKQLQAVGLSVGTRVNIWDGSVRSGKTFSSILRLLAAIADAGPYGEVVIVGKNRDSVYRNVFAPVETLPDFAWVAGQVKYRQGASTGRILGRRVNVIGANDAKAESRIRGMTVQVAYVDEITVIPEDFFKQLLARMSAPGAQLFGTTNPDSPRHWLKTRYLDRLADLPDWRHFRFNLDDNPVLTESYKDSLKREYTGLWYQRFIEGKWVAAEGAIFDRFDVDRHVIPFSETPQIARVLAAGPGDGTTTATPCVVLGLSAEEHPRLVVLDEFRHTPETQGKLTDPEQSERIREFLAGRHHPQQALPPVPYTVIDPAAASLKLQLQKDGLLGLWDAANAVLPGIKTVSALLATGQLVITDRCKALIDEMPSYVWDDKKTDQGVDAPVKENDHSVDALRYAVATTESLWRTALRHTPEVTNATHHRRPVAAA